MHSSPCCLKTSKHLPYVPYFLSSPLEGWKFLSLFIGKSIAHATTYYLCSNFYIWFIIHKDAGRDWGQEEKGTTEDEMAGRHHWLNGCESLNSGSWWWIGRPGVLRFMGSQRVGHDWVTDLIWSVLHILLMYKKDRNVFAFSLNH